MNPPFNLFLQPSALHLEACHHTGQQVEKNYPHVQALEAFFSELYNQWRNIVGVDKEHLWRMAWSYINLHMFRPYQPTAGPPCFPDAALDEFVELSAAELLMMPDTMVATAWERQERVRLTFGNHAGMNPVVMFVDEVGKANLYYGEK
ncbi:hypothetical protein V5O48_010635 [Marasmius crinis-equi]|uniref:Uncharacterized protein n=1 Tax=Marasmius crinis-equi TaxID=585013 RepID=A0ABR3F7U2_9AGAR